MNLSQESPVKDKESTTIHSGAEREKQILNLFNSEKIDQVVKNFQVKESNKKSKKSQTFQDKIFDFVKKSQKGVTTNQVHIYFKISKQLASYHLNKLEERGYISKIGSIYSQNLVKENSFDSNAGGVGGHQNTSLNRLQRFDHYHHNFPLSTWPESFFININWNAINKKTKGRIQYVKKEMFHLSKTQCKIYDPILDFVDSTFNFFYSIKKKTCKLDLVINKFHFDGNRDLARKSCIDLAKLFLNQYQRQHSLSFDFANYREGPYEYRFCKAPRLLQGQSFFKKNYSCDDSFGDGDFELETQSEEFADTIDDLDFTLDVEIKGQLSKIENLVVESSKRQRITERKILAVLNSYNSDLALINAHMSISDKKKFDESMFG